MTVRAPAIQAQFIETYVLLTLNHQISDCHQGQPYRPGCPGARCVWNSDPAGRREQTARCPAPGRPIIAGCSGTACAMADERYGVPAGGTMAHSWVQMFEDEFTAFDAYCAACIPPLLRFWWIPTTCSAPVCQTPSAPFRKHEVLPNGAIRIDSGDLTYLSRQGSQHAGCGGAERMQNCGAPTLWMSILSGICINQGALYRRIRRGRAVDYFQE